MESVTIELPSDVVEYLQEFTNEHCPKMKWQDVLGLWAADMIRARARMNEPENIDAH